MMEVIGVKGDDGICVEIEVDGKCAEVSLEIPTYRRAEVTC